MNVLMKWAKKKLVLEAPKIEKTEESEDAKKEGVKDDDEKMKEEKSEDAKNLKMKQNYNVSNAQSNLGKGAI